MINGNFLRRIEPYPSKDLADRQDLLLFQIEKPLNAFEWLDLVDAKDNPPVEFIQVFDDAVQHFMSYTPHWFQFPYFLPLPIKNKRIIELCLLNRVRHERGLKLVTFQENQWLDYAAAVLLHDIEFLTGMFENAIK